MSRKIDTPLQVVKLPLSKLKEEREKHNQLKHSDEAPAMPVDAAAPKAPEPAEVQAPKMPKLGALGSSEDNTLAPRQPTLSTVADDEKRAATSEQERRDGEAREARRSFDEAEKIAKAKENEAARLRAKASEKLKDANLKKDAACETRLGGKFLCIRGPNSGF